MSHKGYSVFFVGGLPRLCRVSEVPQKTDTDPVCPRCGQSEFEWKLDVIQHGFWEEDILSIGVCPNKHWNAFHATFSHVQLREAEESRQTVDEIPF